MVYNCTKYTSFLSLHNCTAGVFCHPKGLTYVRSILLQDIMICASKRPTGIYNKLWFHKNLVFNRKTQNPPKLKQDYKTISSLLHLCNKDLQKSSTDQMWYLQNNKKLLSYLCSADSMTGLEIHSQI